MYKLPFSGLVVPLKYTEKQKHTPTFDQLIVFVTFQWWNAYNLKNMALFEKSIVLDI